MQQPPWMIGAGWPDPELAEAVLGGPRGRLPPLAWRTARALAAAAGLLLFTQIQHPRQIMDAPSSAHTHLGATEAIRAGRETPVLSLTKVLSPTPPEIEEESFNRPLLASPDSTDNSLNVAEFMGRVAHTNLHLARALDRINQEATK